MSSLSALVLLALVVAAPAHAADPVASSHACASVVEPAERLACYDAAFPPTAAEAVPMLTPEQEREQAVARFGLNRQQVEKREPERRRDEGPARIEDVVAGVSYPKSGGRVVTLDSGQVWLLTDAASKGHLSKGDAVVVRKAALGSYMLVTPARVALRAKRLN
jgi:hypothetical protein